MIPIAWNVEKYNFEKIEKKFTKKIWDLKKKKFWKKLKILKKIEFFSNYPPFTLLSLIFIRTVFRNMSRYQRY